MVLAKVLQPRGGPRPHRSADAMPPAFDNPASSAEIAFGQPQWPFDVTLQEDLKSGAINKMLGVDAKLKVRDVSTPGRNLADDHAYFLLRDVRMQPYWTKAKLSFLVRDGNGYGQAESRELSLRAKPDDGPRTRFHAIDDEALKIREKYDNGEGLYRNHVRRVIFEGGRKLYPAYFKYTPA